MGTSRPAAGAMIAATQIRGVGGDGWRTLLRELAGDRVDRIVFTAASVAVGFGYSVMLPFAFTQHITLANWRYLNARYIAFAVAFALAFAWLITLQVHATRSVLANRSRATASGGVGPIGALAAIVSVMPSLLCCSPILPTLVAAIGFSGATSVEFQYVFATKENLFLGGTLALLVATALWSTRKLARAACMTEQGCTSPAERACR